MSRPNQPRDSHDQVGPVKDVSLTTAERGYGIEALDRIDRHRYVLWTPDPVSPEPAATDQFSFPVDAAVSITTRAITLPTVVPVYVRDETESVVADVEQAASETLPEGVYSLELAAPIKVYLRVESEVTVTSDFMQTAIDFGTEVEVVVGTCSYHERPAATVTTTDDPQDMIAAVSTFASALKTDTPERSFPSNRGHPPLVERGDTLRIPAELEPTKTDVRLELPPDYRSIYAAAPLAYYLGATVVPADSPRLVTDTGFEYALDAGGGFEKTVERVLKRIFFLDCVIRTEGLRPVDLYERRELESYLEFDVASLYGEPTGARIEAYFDVPFSVLASELPDWKVTAHVEPMPENVELLPFLAHRLAIVRTSHGHEVSPPNQHEALIDTFFRSGNASQELQTNATDGPYVRPERTDSLGEIWVGDGIPLGANKALFDAYQNQLGRQPTEEDIEITVICNDIDLSSMFGDAEASMEPEQALVDEVYGSRSELPFEVDTHHNLTVEELRSVLHSPTDFLHYIGHVDEAGMRCTDGTLDAATLETAGPDAFFLNACSSYEQGCHLVHGGSIGGIATLGDLINSEAIQMGQMIARLLNRGFPLYAAHEIARDVILLGGQYAVVGDGGFTIAQAESGVANLCEIEPDDDGYRVVIKTYPTIRQGMGMAYIPYIESNDDYFLGGGSLKPFHLSAAELQRFLTLEDIPVRINGELRWSYEIDVSTL
jgi:hypothetical protein